MMFRITEMFIELYYGGMQICNIFRPLDGIGGLYSRASPFADELLPFRQGDDFLRMLRMKLYDY